MRSVYLRRPTALFTLATVPARNRALAPGYARGGRWFTALGCPGQPWE